MSLGQLFGSALGGIGGALSQHYCTGCEQCIHLYQPQHWNSGQMYYQTKVTDNTSNNLKFEVKYYPEVKGVQPPYDFVDLQKRLDYLAGITEVKQGVPPKRKFRGKVVTYMGEKQMQGYSMGEYNLYEVAAIVLPSKKGDFEGEGAQTLTFGASKEPVMLIVAPNADAAVVRASKMINEEYAVERLKVFVRPFVVDE